MNHTERSKKSTISDYTNKMQKHTLPIRHIFYYLIIALSLPTLKAQDIEVIFPDSFQDGWTQYIGKTVVFNQTLHLCGRSRTQLILAPHRLMTPEEITVEGTTEHTIITEQNKSMMIYANGPEADLTIRSGNKIDRLRAMVTSKNNISILPQTLTWYGNPRPTERPDLDNPSLIICGANLLNYMAEYNEFGGAKNDAEFKRQTNKIVKAFRTIDADIYGLVELQEGQKSIIALTNAINAAYPTPQYSYIYDGDFASTTYTKAGYIYRNTRIKPILTMESPYTAGGIYEKRLKIQAFDDLKDYGRLIISLNHFKAKSGSDNSTTNPIRMQNVQALTKFLDKRLNQNYYNDSDVLIIGDLNAYRLEEPLRHLTSKGYIDQLERYDSQPYSYVYSSQSGRLDHAFASASLSSQVTAAKVFHLNADENSSFGFSTDYNELMYRYSDHDPVLIGLRLKSDESSIDEAEEQPLKVIANGYTIQIKALPEAKITITTLLGQTIYIGQATSVTLPTAGTYIIKSGKRRTKVSISKQ